MNIKNLDYLIKIAKEDMFSNEALKDEDQSLLDLVIIELERLKKEPSTEFSPSLRRMIIDGMSWTLHFFKEYQRVMGPEFHRWDLISKNRK